MTGMIVEDDPRFAASGNGSPLIVHCLPSKQASPSVLTGSSRQLICDLLDVLCVSQPTQSEHLVCVELFSNDWLRI